MNYINKTRMISGAIILIIVAAAALYYFFVPVKIVDVNNYFELSASSKYDFVQNDYKEKDETPTLSKMDTKKQIYLKGSAYKPSDKTLKTLIEDDKKTFPESLEGREVSEIKEFKTKNYEAYKYSFVYEDNAKIDFYQTVYFIEAENGFYIIDIECKNVDRAKYEKDFDKILKTFKELDA